MATSSVDLAHARLVRLLRLLRLLVIGAAAVLALVVYLLVFGLAPQPITTGGALIAVGLGILAGVVLTRRAVVLAIGWRFVSRWTLLLPIARLLLRARH
jgi:hypothetical protein